MIEMLVAMAVLAFIMMFLFRGFSQMQGAWTASVNATELYENGRVALELITRDLQAAIARADDTPGNHIRFHQPDSASLWFVTVGDTTESASSSIIEVGYRTDGHQFERSFVDDSHAEWNVYGPRDDASQQTGYRRVIGEVLSQQFICYDRNMQEYVPDTIEEETMLPNAVTVVLQLMDSRSYLRWQNLPEDKKAEYERQVTRTFRKTLYLGVRDASQS